MNIIEAAYLEDHNFWRMLTYPTGWDEVGSPFLMFFNTLMYPVITVMLTGIIIGVVIRLIRSTSNAS